jgi:hypothetical protein
VSFRPPRVAPKAPENTESVGSASFHCFASHFGAQNLSGAFFFGVFFLTPKKTASPFFFSVPLYFFLLLKLPKPLRIELMIASGWLQSCLKTVKLFLPRLVRNSFGLPSLLFVCLSVCLSAPAFHLLLFPLTASTFVASPNVCVSKIPLFISCKPLFFSSDGEFLFGGGHGHGHGLGLLSPTAKMTLKL